MRVADLEVHVGYDGAEAERGLRGVGDSASKAGGFLSSAASTMVGMVGASALLPAVGAAGSFVADSMIGLSSNLEMARNGFTNMLGSSEAAEAHLQQLQQFAATSPFEFKDVAAASQKLLAMGIAADDVVPTLSSVGNAVAAMGGGQEQIDRVTTAIGQMNAKGKVSAEEMMQLAESGIPAWDMLAQSMGKSVAETQKLVSEGQVGSDVFLTAFNEEVPKRFGDSMAAQAQTLPGLMSTMKDTLSMGLAGMAGPLMDNLKQAVGSLNQSLGPLMAAVGTAFGPLLGSVGETISMLAGQLTPILTQLAPIIGQTATLLADALGGVLQELVPVLGSILNAAAPILPMLADLAGVIVGALAPVLALLLSALVPIIDAIVQGLQPVMEAIKPIFPQLAAALSPLLDVLVKLLLAFTPLIPPLIQMSSIFVTTLLPILIPVIAYIAQLATQLIDFLMPAVEAIVGWLSEFVTALASLDFGKVLDMLDDLWSNITSWVTSGATRLGQLLLEWIPAFLGWIREVVPQIPGKLFELWWGVETWIGEQALKLPGLLWGWITSFVSWVGPAWVEMQAKLLELAGSFANWIIDQAVTLPGRMLGWIGAFTQWLGPALLGLLMKLGELQLQLWAWIADQAAQMPGRILGWVQGFLSWAAPLLAQLPGKLAEIAGSISAWVIGLPGQIVAWAGDIGSKMLDLGRRLVEGIWNGISKAKDWIMGKIGEFTGSIVDGIKSFFGINSPARTMLPVGLGLAEGIALGLRNNLGLVEGALGDVTSLAPTITATTAAGATWGGSAAGGSGPITVQVFRQDPAETTRALASATRTGASLPVGVSRIG